MPPRASLVDGRTVFICGISVLLAAAAALVAQVLVRLIGLITNISFFGRVSTEFTSPAENHLGLWVLLIPVIGGLIVGLMARYGSPAIRGHGIPEAMEQVLTNRSRIAPRVTLLKPISAAISIGTGGPFGAEGPIIATGGALGSVVGQFISTTASERKTLLAVGAAAGMAATFGSPVSAVLLAVELLLFEYRPRSLIPVALASTTAAGIRMMFEGAKPIFAMPDVTQATGGALSVYILIGAALGLLAVFVTRAVYAIEDAFDRLPFHWMWWPALGAVAVGVVGYFVPRTLGVGYSNIGDLISGRLAVQAMVVLAAAKFVSWAISLGSGTSGGTLAPLFTIGGGAGAILGTVLGHLMPSAGIDPRVAGLVGMAAIFSGASRALLASIVFAFETTMQPHGLLPLLGGCTASYLVSCLMMRQTIMTEKIHRRGVRVPIEYAADFFDQLIVAEVASKNVVRLLASDTLAATRAWLSSGEKGSSHQGFPVCDEKGNLVGVLTRRDLLATGQPANKRLGDVIRRPPVVVYHDCTLREAADHMVNHDIGRLPVVSRDDRRQLVGMITRSDLLSAHRRRLGEHVPEPAIPMPMAGIGRKKKGRPKMVRQTQS
ncbi:MAG TPA: chloride channel protein [Phycisphaerae bacterium]|nr:chloride channel protein [Phycisphaerae bacterium]